MKKKKQHSPAVVQPTDFTKLLEEEKRIMKRFSREEILANMEIDHVIIDGKPDYIGVRPEINRKFGAKPHTLADIRELERRQNPLLPPEPEEDLVPLGSWAEEFIAKADRKTKTVVFSNHKNKKLQVMANRTMAWEVVELVLGGKKEDEGWVKLPPRLAKWAANFRVGTKPLPGGSEMADPYHDMTKLRHHIVNQRTRGKKIGKETDKNTYDRLQPKINHETYDPVVTAFEEAKKVAQQRLSEKKMTSN